MFESLAFSPDGTELAIASSGSMLAVYLLWTFPGRYCVVFSPDGKTIATADQRANSKSGSVKGNPAFLRQWDTASGQLRRSLRDVASRPAGIESVAFSPDGATLASVDRRGVVRLFDMRTGSLDQAVPLSRIEKGVDARLSFSPDGKTLAVSVDGFENGGVALVDVASGDHRYVLWFRRPGIPWALYATGLLAWSLVWWKCRRRGPHGASVVPQHATNPLAGARG